MKVLAVVSQKGGVGKTTLSTALAVEATRDGKKTVMFDLDPQASASFWKDTRKDESLAITAIPAARLAHVSRPCGRPGATSPSSTPRPSPRTLPSRPPSRPTSFWSPRAPRCSTSWP